MGPTKNIFPIIENISFNSYGFIEDYNENLFKEAGTYELKTDNNIYNVTVATARSQELSEIAIITLKSENGNELKLAAKTSHLQRLLKNQAALSDSKNEINKLVSTTQQLFHNAQAVIAEQRSLDRIIYNCKAEINEERLKENAFIFADALLEKIKNKEWNLHDEMVRAGLTEENIALITSKGAGCETISEFLKRGSSFSLNATIIGLNHKEIIPGMKNVFECEDYIEAYERLFHSPAARDDFLEHLTEENTPIIFLVPRKLMNHSKTGITAGEMGWLLKNPTKMENVQFVFGAYQICSKKEFSAIDSKKKSDFIAFVNQRLFEQIKGDFHLPTYKYDSKKDENKIEELERKLSGYSFTPFEKGTKGKQVNVEQFEPD